MTPIMEQIKEVAERYRLELRQLNRYIYDNPELGLAEHLSAQAHVDLLEKYGFQVEMPYLGFDTAFRAVYDSGKEGPSLAFLSEYDALPGIGHACGHNLLGATDTISGIVLSEFVKDRGGRVIVLGTPAEETWGTKVNFADQGAFDDIDVAFCTHPADNWQGSSTSMAMKSLSFEFFGKTSHAAESPHEGINALDAAVNFYVATSMLRQQMNPTNRIHGVIKSGGEAANIIPDYSRLEFYVRALSMSELDLIETRVLACAEAAALASGCQLKWTYDENTFMNMVTNKTLSERYNDNMASLGVTMIREDRMAMGSLDMGNVSQVVPSINPYFDITAGVKTPGHTVAFREASLTPYAEDSAMLTVQGLVATALDLIDDPRLLEEVVSEFEANVKVD